MLSFNNLGNLGRLSNQMFQYASLKGIAKHRGFEYCVPPREVFGKLDKNVRDSETCLYDVFSIEESNNVQLTDYKLKQESHFHFDEKLYNECDDDSDLYGFFQSEKYFIDIKDEIKKDFKFSDQLISQCKEFYDQIFSDTEVISLHIRRGDYTKNPNHPVQSNEYYQKSLEQLDGNIPVIVFSDDPEWCYQNNLFESDRFFISNNATDFDLCLMTMCDYHITANSSYSWWGAWLSESKKVIAPKKWFGGDCSKHSTEDLYCSNWFIL